jgi:LPS-assembly protein
LGIHYYGVEDRGLPGPNGTLIPEGGSEARLLFTTDLTHGWRGVADVNYLSSLTFRLAFATTFNEAIISEEHSDTFATNNFRGFSLNIAALNYKDFLNAQPETSIVLRSAPEIRFSSAERAFWDRWPVYFGFDSVSGAVRRSDTLIDTAQYVERSELAPHMTLPVRWGSWFGITTTAGFRFTDYNERLVNGMPAAQGLVRTDGEFSVQLRPPAFERIWNRGKTKWKHVIEPLIAYNYVTGIQDSSRIIRFDEDDTITDTSEVESALTQRFFRKTGDGQAEEFLTWRVAAKYYFDPTFGGALVPGQRNVFAALDSITPFAFADEPRHWSPIVSDVKMNYSARYDIQLETDYDPLPNRLSAYGLIGTVHPYGQSFLSLAQFRLHTDPILQPRQNQIRVTGGWGQMNRKGWNTATSLAYDTIQHTLQYEVVQASYNGSCCGISFEYRRLALGPLRNDNQFRAALLIANIGTFGTLRRQERVF